MYEPYMSRIQFSGTQKIYKFDNNFGASVVQHEYSYGGNEGMWELAVLKFDEEGEWDITYETPITADVLGWLSWEEVEEKLTQIGAL